METTPRLGIQVTERKVLLLEQDGSDHRLSELIASWGWEIQVVADPAAARAVAGRGRALVGLIVLDPPDAFELSEVERLTAHPGMEWIAVLSPKALLRPACARLILDSFYDYHTLPVDPNRLAVILGHAFGKADLQHNLERRRDWRGRYDMIGASPAMLQLYRRIDRVVGVDAPVLITGESGTGKELVARAIHKHSARKTGPFVAVNCAELPENLIQSALFGHERGAFTGAHQRRVGSIEAAAGGVIFLDEIGDLRLDLQANLLRFLQDKTIVRVGSTQRMHVDVRVVAATHVDLKQAVDAGRFREDLFYRLNVLSIHVPSLASREGDLHLLTEMLLTQFEGTNGHRMRGISQDAIRAMSAYSWPGNVRELINRMQHALVMSDNRLITPADLELPPVPEDTNVTTLSSARAAASRDVIVEVLKRAENNVSEAARKLGISRITLYRLMEKFDIDRSD
ncbi:MAG: sigma-54 dependent transcriptional regulator [Burkholderiales bacterium]|nr:sigma-54 dependent transcriptional regulator [Burkholderiales bacterium]